MKIESVKASLGSRAVSNDEAVDLIRFNSRDNFDGNLEKTLRKIKVVLKKTGIINRAWLDKKQKPIDHLVDSAERALKDSKLHKNDIDLLIYVGIGRGFLEPGNSYPAAHALGLKNARCFDVIDACMSWSAALQIADNFLKIGSYKKIMIVNAEFTVNAGPLLKNFTIQSEKQLSWTFPTYTVGEAASATILGKDDSNDFNFNFLSRPDLADLCTIPTSEYEGYCIMNEQGNENGPFHFTSRGKELHDYARIEAPKVFNELVSKTDDKIDIIFTHASSRNEWDSYGKLVGFDNKIYHIYQDTGNLVSASVPSAMSIAEDNNVLKRGDSVVSWVGSAGMSFCANRFKF